MNFKHNDRVTCKIHVTEITNASISIDKDGMPFICQNEIDGGEADDKLGYKYSWYPGEYFTRYGLTDLKLATPTWDSLSWKDIVLDGGGDRRMVLAVSNDMACVSHAEDFETASGWYHKKELQHMYFTIQGAAPAIEEITIAEAEARLGVKIKTD